MESFDSRYDYDSTIFSPDGRLFQVEYARETIKKGSTTLALKYQDGVILLSYKKNSSNLVEKSSFEKITQIDNNFVCAYIGLSADARHLIDFCRETAVNYRFLYDEQITIKGLVEEICSYEHLFTTFGGLRPFGLVLLIAGIDTTGIHLYATDPSGAFLGHKAICEGKNSDNVIKYLDQHYKENLTCIQAINLALSSIKKTFKGKINIEGIEVGIIDRSKTYYKLSKKELEKIMK